MLMNSEGGNLRYSFFYFSGWSVGTHRMCPSLNMSVIEYVRKTMFFRGWRTHAVCPYAAPCRGCFLYGDVPL